MLKGQFKGAVVFFFYHVHQYFGETWRPIAYQESAIHWSESRANWVDEVGTRGQIGQKPKNNMAASGVVNRSGADSAFERHRSRVTFDLAKQSSVAAVKKHLTEFLGLWEISFKFGTGREGTAMELTKTAPSRTSMVYIPCRILFLFRNNQISFGAYWHGVLPSQPRVSLQQFWNWCSNDKRSTIISSRCFDKCFICE